MKLKIDSGRLRALGVLLPSLLLPLASGCSSGTAGFPAATAASAPASTDTGAGTGTGTGTGTGGQTSAGAVKVWLTTGDQSKLLSREADIDIAAGAPAAGVSVIDIDPATRYQEMTGFGAAMTDASAWLLRNRMSSQQRAELMQDLFGSGSGVGFSFMRVTVGASDYSRTHYSFDDVAAGATDPQLSQFSIDPHRADVLPAIKEARALNPGLRIMATPWSPPAWMKTSGSLIKGTLKPEAYGPFAEYLKRFLDAYKAEGVPVFALSIQNEPDFEPADYPGMRLDPAQRASIIGGYVGPLLAQTHPDTRILEWDHNWDKPESPATVLADANAAKYISGVAWHCYAGSVEAQTTVHNQFPGKDSYFTECSGGDWAPNWSDNLQYNVGTLLIGATRGWAKGVLLWNLALDENHGPRLGGCTNCRGVVTINSATGAVTRNPEYYALAHASKFVRPGAQRIASNSIAGGVQTVAFRNADDGTLVLLAANPTMQEQRFAARVGARVFTYTLAARAVATLTWSGN